MEDGVEAPTEALGASAIRIDADGTWRDRLGQWLRAAGLAVDLESTA